MAAPETIEKPLAQSEKPETAQSGKDACPSGTMFDPESMRKFLDHLKSDAK